MYQEIGLDPEGSSAAEKEAAVATVCQERIDACAVPLAPASPLLYGVFVSDQDVPGYSADSVVDTLQAW